MVSRLFSTLGVALALLCAARAQAEPLPISEFLTRPVIQDVTISPDGASLATILQGGLETQLVISDLKAKTTKTIITAKRPKDLLASVAWKGNDRLVVTINHYLDLQKLLQGGASVFVGDASAGEIFSSRQLMIISRDGASQMVLDTGENLKVGSMRVTPSMELLDTLRSDPDHFLTTAPYGIHRAPTVFKYDVRTGRPDVVEWGGAQTIGWNLNSKGDVVIRLEARGDATSVQSRKPGDSEWKEVTRYTRKDEGVLADFEVLGASEDPLKIYVAAAPKTAAEGDVRNVHLFDLATKTMGPALWSNAKYDIEGILSDPETDRMLGVCFYADVWTCESTDPKFASDRAALVKFFEGDRNVSIWSQSDDGQVWVLKVSGADEPLSYYLFDRRTKHVDLVGSAYPKLAADRLGDSKPYRYKARDGFSIPAYLTRPPGAPASHLPLIVMPHGGPELRDHLGYDQLAQFLASRGYLVLQPNFRGSGGYGVAFRDAGRQQWGLRSQDDIDDGARALIAEGLADPQRVCIVGASYGGYAALTGGAKSPSLYKCVVSIAGVSDLAGMLGWERDKGDPITFDYWRSVIGDPERDAEKLRTASAISYAAHYGPPVLLIHGAADGTVPIHQSEEMEAALKAAGRDVQFVRLKGGHGNWNSPDWTLLMTELEKFLAAHLPIAPAATKPAA